ncbi:MAG: hypothetical protein K0Q59_4497, partial [Paenibacillus sp.]|nr:hypothetical protein [Paenibacillus sp.]
VDENAAASGVELSGEVLERIEGILSSAK